MAQLRGQILSLVIRIWWPIHPLLIPNIPTMLHLKALPLKCKIIEIKIEIMIQCYQILIKNINF